MAPKPKFMYNEKDMKNSIATMKNGEKSVYKASVLYKVPR